LPNQTKCFPSFFAFLLETFSTVAVLDYDDDEGEGDEYYDDVSDGGKGK
jgi:hypothetical protein